MPSLSAAGSFRNGNFVDSAFRNHCGLPNQTVIIRGAPSGGMELKKDQCPLAAFGPEDRHNLAIFTSPVSGQGISTESMPAALPCHHGPIFCRPSGSLAGGLKIS